MSAFRTVVVGVADLAPVRALWIDLFGFEAVPQPEGRLRALTSRWGLPGDAINDVLQLRTPGCEAGQLLFVQFRDGADSVRAGAAPTDRCPKNLDVYVDDLPARLPALRNAGCRFRNDTPSEVTAPNGVRFRELHLHGHDDLNIVLLQLLDESMAFSPKGFAGIGALVTIVGDPAAEVSFHAANGGFEPVAKHRLDGPEIERMIGLPPGAALDITILGGQHHLGQLEVIAYEGVEGKDRYPRTRPPARGILEIELNEDSLNKRLARSPAGFRVWGDAEN